MTESEHLYRFERRTTDYIAHAQDASKPAINPAAREGNVVQLYLAGTNLQNNIRARITQVDGDNCVGEFMGPHHLIGAPEWVRALEKGDAVHFNERDIGMLITRPAATLWEIGGIPFEIREDRQLVRGGVASNWSCIPVNGFHFANMAEPTRAALFEKMHPHLADAVESTRGAGKAAPDFTDAPPRYIGVPD